MNMANRRKINWKKKCENLVKKVKKYSKNACKSLKKYSKKINSSVILIIVFIILLTVSNICTYMVVNKVMSDNIVSMKQYYDSKIDHTEKEIKQIYKKLEIQSKNIEKNKNTIKKNKVVKKPVVDHNFRVFGAKVYKGMAVHTIDKCKNFVFKTSNGVITLTEKQYKKALCKYIIKYNPEKNPEYVNRVADGFIKLTRYFGENKNFVLYYVALCGVESGYKSNVVSCCGAQGIPQVMWSVWHGTAEKNWNINKNQFNNSIFNQLYVGMKIYEIQYKKYRNNIRLAHNAYSGGTPGYHVKVVRRYNELLCVMQSV